MGRIITFYSYKGGTGRSMAVANVAWILATNGKRVLVVDWDLEAPGLHFYFRPFLLDKTLRSTEGIFDLVFEYALAALTPGEEDAGSVWYKPYANILRYAVSLDWDFRSPGVIDFVPAGRQDTAYASKVSTFTWQNFYEYLGGGRLLEGQRKHAFGIRLHPNRQPHRRERHVRYLHDSDAGHVGPVLHIEQAKPGGCRVGREQCARRKEAPRCEHPSSPSTDAH